MSEYMNYFVVILLLGIILASMLLLLVVTAGTQKRKQIQDLNVAGEKLEKILAESETMIEEMNRFSDYVVSLMEEKDNQLKVTSKYAEDILNRISDITDSRSSIQKAVSESANDLLHETISKPLQNGFKQNTALQKTALKKDNVVPMNPKHREILEMAEYGLTDTDIAKSLQMGKGEVQLILGMKKG